TPSQPINGTPVYQPPAIASERSGPSTIPTKASDSAVEVNVSALLSHKLDDKELTVVSEKPLASGAYGEVWLGSYWDQSVAIKRIRNKEPAYVAEFIEEIKLLARMESPYIVQFIGVRWSEPIDIECVVEYMDMGDLRNYLSNHPPESFSWERKLTSILSIARGLVYLHMSSPPIIHRDLKSRNGTKLSDFGSSREMDDETLTAGVGTYQWMAPEIILGGKYSLAADMYSFGIVLAEFSTHVVPYSDMINPSTNRPWNQQYIITKVTTGQLTPNFDSTHTPEWVREMALKCLQLDPEARPTSLQLLTMLTKLM
ncbi:protein kinase, partial [Achlya hypogyna]